MGRRPREAAVAAAVAGDVHVVVVVDVDAVLAGRPDAALLLLALPPPMKPSIGRAAPGVEQVALLVELHHRRRRDAAVGDRAVGPRVAERVDRHLLAVLVDDRRDRRRRDRHRRRSPRPRRWSASGHAGGSRCCRAGRPRCRRPGRGPSCWAAAWASADRPRSRAISHPRRTIDRSARAADPSDPATRLRSRLQPALNRPARCRPAQL